MIEHPEHAGEPRHPGYPSPAPDPRVTALVGAARAGDPRAQDELISLHLPLVYNVVGRALGGHADVDDVVQDTMVRALGGLDGLRSPESFRSWLVAIAVNRVRAHRQDRGGVPGRTGLDEVAEVADPGADFVDLTLVRLYLSGQRQETARATRWLDPKDRELLSLWWLECAGHLTRQEVSTAIGLPPRHTAVRVQRMKATLETSRVVVRALDARPTCPELAAVLAGWDGRPAALWRKRISRHARECVRCAAWWQGLVPAEGLLVGLGLVPVVALGLPAAIRAGLDAYGGAGLVGAWRPAEPVEGLDPVGFAHTPDAGAPDPGLPVGFAGGPAHPGRAAARAAGRGARRRRERSRRRAAAVGVVAACVAGGGLVYLGTFPEGGGVVAGDPTSGTPVAALDASGRAPAPSGSTGPDPSASASASPSPSSSPSASASPGASRSASPSASASASAAPRRSTRPTSRAPEAPAPRTPNTSRGSRPTADTPPADAGVVAQVIALVNKERAAAGCSPVSDNAKLRAAAQGHSQDMAARDYFDHTAPDGSGPGERTTAAGYRWTTYGENIARGQQTAAAVMESWMNSPGHRANILNCSFEDLGVGYHEGPGGPWWTQNFGAGG
ncbi:sigma-70 family RNA polymerase sigma factor [Streptomyces sp. BI20]|uniref:sigma-70 family RNA polymerase sigma factor n=1 Tax=Streptomyces sp. BI20 TaxID=3403460 RepID=UPI003C769EE8